MVSFEIIYSENYFKTKKFRLGAFTIFGILFMLIGRKANGLVFTIGLPEVFEMLSVLLLLIIGIYLLVSYWYSRKSKSLGKALLNEDKIEILSDQGKIAYNLMEIDKLKIIQNTFVGPDYESSPLNNYYGDNWIQITENSKQVNYEFKLDSHYKNVQLSKLIDRWKAHLDIFEYEQK